MDPPQSYHINNPFCNVKGIGRRTGKPIYKKRVVEDGMHSFDAYLSESDASTTFCPTPVTASSSPQSSANENDVDLTPKLSHLITKTPLSENPLPRDGDCVTFTEVQTILAQSETHVSETSEKNNESFPESIRTDKTHSQVAKSQCTDNSSFKLVDENIPNKPPIQASKAKLQKVSQDENNSQKTQDVTLMNNIKLSDSTTEDRHKQKSQDVTQMTIVKQSDSKLEDMHKQSSSLLTDLSFKKTAQKLVFQQSKDQLPTTAVEFETDAHFLIANSGLDSGDSSTEDDKVKKTLALNKVPVHKNSTQKPDLDFGIQSDTQKIQSEKLTKQTSNSPADQKSSDSDAGMVEGQPKSVVSKSLGNPVSQANKIGQVKTGAETCGGLSEHMTSPKKSLPLSKKSTAPGAATISDLVPDKASHVVNQSQKSEIKSLTPEKREHSKTLDFGGDVTGSVSNTEKISTSQFFGIKKRLTFSKVLPEDLRWMKKETQRQNYKSFSASLNNYTYDNLPVTVSSDPTRASDVNPTSSLLNLSTDLSDDFCIVDNESAIVTITSKDPKHGKSKKDNLNSTQAKTSSQKLETGSRSLTVKHQQSINQPKPSTVEHKQPTNKNQQKQRNLNKKNRQILAIQPDCLNTGDVSLRPILGLVGEDSQSNKVRNDTLNADAQQKQNEENLPLQIAGVPKEVSRRKSVAKCGVPSEGVGVNKSRNYFIDYSLPLNEFAPQDNQQATTRKQGKIKSNVKTSTVKTEISAVKKAARTRRSKANRSKQTNKEALNISTHSFNEEKSSTNSPHDDLSDADVTPVKLKLISALPGVTPVSGVSFRWSQRNISKFKKQNNQSSEEEMGSPTCMRTATPSCLRDNSSIQPKRRKRKVRISQYIEQKEMSPGIEAENPGFSIDPMEATLLSVTSSPVHYAETTTNVEYTKSKSPKLTIPDLSYKIVRPPEIEDVGLRRSKRTRVKRLDASKGEGIIYRRDSSGFGLVVDGIQPSVVEAKFKAQQEERRKKLRQRRMRAMTVPAQTKKRLSSHFKLEHNVTFSTHLPVINPDTNEEVVLDVIACPTTWCNADLQPVSKTDPLAVCLKLQQPGFCTGDLHMRPLAEKASELAVQTLIFTVIHGKICFTLNGIPTIVESGMDFFIPRGSTYALKNLRRDIAKLFFIDLNDNCEDASTSN